MANAENQEERNKNQAVPDSPDEAYSKYIDPDFKKKQEKKKLLIIVSAITAVLAILAVVAAVVFYASSDNAENAPQEATETVKACEDESCFDEYFRLCLPAKFEFNETEEDTLGYEVTGIQDVGCLVKIEYISSGSPDHDGKSMTCDLDNELTISEAKDLAIIFPEDYDCEGDLANFLYSLNEEA